MNRRDFLQRSACAVFAGGCGGVATGVALSRGHKSRYKAFIEQGDTHEEARSKTLGITGAVSLGVGTVTAVFGFMAGKWMFKDFNNDSDNTPEPK